MALFFSVLFFLSFKEPFEGKKKKTEKTEKTEKNWPELNVTFFFSFLYPHAHTHLWITSHEPRTMNPLEPCQWYVPYQQPRKNNSFTAIAQCTMHTAHYTLYTAHCALVKGEAWEASLSYLSAFVNQKRQFSYKTSWAALRNSQICLSKSYLGFP